MGRGSQYDRPLQSLCALSSATSALLLLLLVTHDSNPARCLPPTDGGQLPVLTSSFTCPDPATMPWNDLLSLGCSSSAGLSRCARASATRAFAQTGEFSSVLLLECCDATWARRRSAVLEMHACTHAEAPASFRTPDRGSMAASCAENLSERDCKRSSRRALVAAGKGSREQGCCELAPVCWTCSQML